MNLSLRLFVIAAAALLPTTAVLAYNLLSLRAAQEAEVHAQAARIAELVSLEINQIVYGTENLLTAVAAAPVVRRGEVDGCTEYLSGILERLPQFVSIGIVDKDGSLRCTTGPLVAEVFLGDRGYFLEARKSGGRVIGEYNEGRVTGRPSLPIAIPSSGSGPWSDGVVVAGLDLAWLGERLKGRSFAPGSAVTIADRNGRILAREPLPEDFVGTVIPETFQHLVTAPAPGTLELTSQDGTRRVIGYRPVAAVPDGLYVSAGISTADAFAGLDRAALRALLIALASVLLAVLLARWTSEAFVTRPVRQLVGTVDRWRRADLDARTGMSGTEGELGAVGKAIDDFMDDLSTTRALQVRSESQRGMLLGELDHRVKNLLATVQAVARQSFRGPERSEAADVFLKRLATMSDAHGLLMRDEWQEAEMREVIEVAVAPFDDPGHPQFALAGPRFLLNSKAALAFGMALHELCTNAAKYGALGHAEGKVDVTWAVAPGQQGGGDAFRFTWRERGGPPVVPPQQTGFGSKMIEQALAQQIGGEVTIEFRPEGVLCVATAPVSVVGSKR